MKIRHDLAEKKFVPWMGLDWGASWDWVGGCSFVDFKDLFKPIKIPRGNVSLILYCKYISRCCILIDKHLILEYNTFYTQCLAWCLI